jgi:hypothetical protein
MNNPLGKKIQKNMLFKIPKGTRVHINERVEGYNEAMSLFSKQEKPKSFPYVLPEDVYMKDTDIALQKEHNYRFYINGDYNRTLLVTKFDVKHYLKDVGVCDSDGNLILKRKRGRKELFKLIDEKINL